MCTFSPVTSMMSSSFSTSCTPLSSQFQMFIRFSMSKMWSKHWYITKNLSIVSLLAHIALLMDKLWPFLICTSGNRFRKFHNQAQPACFISLLKPFRPLINAHLYAKFITLVFVKGNPHLANFLMISTNSLLSSEVKGKWKQNVSIFIL